MPEPRALQDEGLARMSGFYFQALRRGADGSVALCPVGLLILSLCPSIDVRQRRRLELISQHFSIVASDDPFPVTQVCSLPRLPEGHGSSFQQISDGTTQ